MSAILVTPVNQMPAPAAGPAPAAEQPNVARPLIEVKDAEAGLKAVVELLVSWGEKEKALGEQCKRVHELEHQIKEKHDRFMVVNQENTKLRQEIVRSGMENDELSRQIQALHHHVLVINQQNMGLNQQLHYLTSSAAPHLTHPHHRESEAVNPAVSSYPYTGYNMGGAGAYYSGVRYSPHNYPMAGAHQHAMHPPKQQQPLPPGFTPVPVPTPVSAAPPAALTMFSPSHSQAEGPRSMSPIALGDGNPVVMSVFQTAVQTPSQTASATAPKKPAAEKEKEVAQATPTPKPAEKVKQELVKHLGAAAVGATAVAAAPPAPAASQVKKGWKTIAPSPAISLDDLVALADGKAVNNASPPTALPAVATLVTNEKGNGENETTQGTQDNKDTKQEPVVQKKVQSPLAKPSGKQSSPKQGATMAEHWNGGVTNWSDEGVNEPGCWFLPSRLVHSDNPFKPIGKGEEGAIEHFKVCNMVHMLHPEQRKKLMCALCGHKGHDSASCGHWSTVCTSCRKSGHSATSIYCVNYKGGAEQNQWACYRLVLLGGRPVAFAYTLPHAKEIETESVFRKTVAQKTAVEINGQPLEVILVRREARDQLDPRSNAYRTQVGDVKLSLVWPDVRYEAPHPAK